MKRFIFSIFIIIGLFIGLSAQEPILLPAHEGGKIQREQALEVIKFLDEVAAAPDFKPQEYDRLAAEFVTHFINEGSLIGAGFILHRTINTLFDPWSPTGFKGKPFHLAAATAEYYLRGGVLTNCADWTNITLLLCKDEGPECVNAWMKTVFNLCALRYLDHDKEGALKMYDEEVGRLLEIRNINKDIISPDVYNSMLYCALLLSNDFLPEDLLSTYRLVQELDIADLPPSSVPFIQMYLCKQMINKHADPITTLDFYKKLVQSNPTIGWLYAGEDILRLAERVGEEEYVGLLPEAYFYAQDNVGTLLNAFSVYDTENFWNKKASALNEVFALGLNRLPHNYIALTSARLNSIFTKNLSVQGYNDTWRFVRQKGTKEYKELLDKVIDLRKRLGQETDSLKRKDILAESDFREWGLRASIDMQNNISIANNKAVLTWHQLDQYEECQVEIIEYIHKSDKEIPSKHYGAVICSVRDKWMDSLKGMFPMDHYEFVDLGAVSVWERIYTGNYRNTHRRRALQYSEDERISVAKLFAPLVDKIKGFKRAYVSTAGELNRVNIGALHCWDTSADTPLPEIVNDVVEIVRIFNTSDLKEIKQRKPTFKNAMIFSNINYDGIAPPSSEDTDNPTSLYRLNIEKGGNVKRFISLPIDGSALEKSVRKATRKVTHLSGNKASEEAFKSIDGKAPELIHLDSHGFYIPESDNAFLGKHRVQGTRERALLTCGLPLSGANKAWSGEEIDKESEDGVLTAWEISCMDLSSCKLAVLSACETASGDNDPINGVLGLQRALKIAGVQSMLLTLWPVDNELTQEFINDFYIRLPHSSTFNEAFVAAQRQFRRRHPDPYIWVPFILLN